MRLMTYLMKCAIKCIVLSLCAAGAWASAEPIDAEASNTDPIKVVTSFSILADWVRVIGAEHVTVKSLVGPDEDVHVFRPSPKDIVSVSKAEILVVNGLRLEGWLSRMVESSGFRGTLVIASDGINPVGQPSFSGGKSRGHDHHHSDSHSPDVQSSDVHSSDFENTDLHKAHSAALSKRVDPHAWLSLKMAEQYLANIAEHLGEARPTLAAEFAAKFEAYVAELRAMDERLTQRFASLAPEQRQFVMPHNAFAYLARDYDLRIFSLQGLDSAAETSAGRFASVVRQLRAIPVKAIFGENISSNRLIARVASEANVPLGGFLISGALSEPDADSYLKMMRHNATVMLAAMESSAP